MEMNQQSIKGIEQILRKIQEVDASLASAESTLAQLLCDQDSSTISVILAGVEFRLTEILYAPGRQQILRPVPGFEELLKACVNAQKARVFRLRSQAEGLRWKLNQEAKKV